MYIQTIACDFFTINVEFYKHLMTGPKRNSEFCFPETLNVLQGEAQGNIEVEGKQNSLFPTGPVVKCFVIHVPPSSKIENMQGNHLLGTD